MLNPAAVPASNAFPVPAPIDYKATVAGAMLVSKLFAAKLFAASEVLNQAAVPATKVFPVPDLSDHKATVAAAMLAPKLFSVKYLLKIWHKSVIKLKCLMILIVAGSLGADVALSEGTASFGVWNSSRRCPPCTTLT